MPIEAFGRRQVRLQASSSLDVERGHLGILAKHTMKSLVLAVVILVISVAARPLPARHGSDGEAGRWQDDNDDVMAVEWPTTGAYISVIVRV